MWSQQVAQATQLSDLDLNQWHKYRQQQLGGELDCVLIALGKFRAHWAQINQLNERNELTKEKLINQMAKIIKELTTVIQNCEVKNMQEMKQLATAVKSLHHSIQSISTL